ncbi:probable ethanolamine kinase isoform X1 [Tanacetum coccineum]
MVQSFIHARTLDVSDMRRPKMVAEIAKQLKNFHQVDVPGSKEPQLWTDILKFLESGIFFDIPLPASGFSVH